MSVELVSAGQKSVLLLDTEPWLLFLNLVEDSHGMVSEVGLGWDQVFVGGIFPNEGLCQNKDVVSSSEGIWEHGNWLADNFRVLSGCHVA